MTGFAFTEHWPDAGEWYATDAYFPGEGAMVGFNFTGEHDDEFDTHELGQRVADFMEGENPPYPGWTPCLPWELASDSG